MSEYLVIVESPAKVKTIKKFLGANYVVMASNGHVRDLPKSALGIDVDHDYEPKYITIRGKGDILSALRKEVKKADKVYLATDPDREGEAISWHLFHALNLQGKKVYRITFNEITKNAVKESIKNARQINMDLVDAQQARRMLDRMVGYRISPLLWTKVKRGLSAGRVQSVALRIICDREAEIDAFVPEEYWTVDATLKMDGIKKPILAKFYGTTTDKLEVKSEAEAMKIAEAVQNGTPKVSEVKSASRTKKAPLPFTTSTLQQEAGKALNFSTQKTMRIAQKLYEGVDIKGEGTIGIITYLRTDSTRISDEARAVGEKFIENTYGKEYVAAGVVEKKNSNKIQDAHEAIRPTNVELLPSQIKDSLTRDELRLYQLIWKRFVASLMAPAVYETTSVKVNVGGYRYTVAASKLSFDGFRNVYTEAEEESEENNLLLKSIDKDTELSIETVDPKQHFTQPVPHFTESSLVKSLEELGIGRPSTYAPTITTILARHYITKENKNIFVTDLGEVVNRMMVEAFPSIVDVNFTANMEALLDGVEEGTVNYKTVVSNFYPDLDEAVKAAEKDLSKIKVADEVTDELCDVCGKNMVIKYGPHGKFLACPGFPECRFTKPYYEKLDIPCPKCGKEIVIKKTRKGRRFYGCIDNPTCDYMVWQRPKAETAGNDKK